MLKWFGYRQGTTGQCRGKAGGEGGGKNLLVIHVSYYVGFCVEGLEEGGGVSVYNSINIIQRRQLDKWRP